MYSYVTVYIQLNIHLFRLHLSDTAGDESGIQSPGGLVETKPDLIRVIAALWFVEQAFAIVDFELTHIHPKKQQEIKLTLAARLKP